MKTAIFQFKCRLCGCVYDDAHIGESHALMRLMGILMNNDSGLGNPVTQTTAHYCANGNVGVADIIGYRIEENNG